MADCNDTLRELQTFLDNELSEDAQHAIRAHLGGCGDCLEAFDFHAELKTVVARKCRTDEIPPGLMAKVEQCFGQAFGDGEMVSSRETVDDGETGRSAHS